MIAQVLKAAGTYKDENGRRRRAYNAERADGSLIATVQERTRDGGIHRICWYGGTLHGKVELVEGGQEGLMDRIAQAA